MHGRAGKGAYEVGEYSNGRSTLYACERTIFQVPMGRVFRTQGANTASRLASRASVCDMFGGHKFDTLRESHGALEGTKFYGGE